MSLSLITSFCLFVVGLADASPAGSSRIHPASTRQRALPVRAASPLSAIPVVLAGPNQTAVLTGPSGVMQTVHGLGLSVPPDTLRASAHRPAIEGLYLGSSAAEELERSDVTTTGLSRIGEWFDQSARHSNEIKPSIPVAQEKLSYWILATAEGRASHPRFLSQLPPERSGDVRVIVPVTTALSQYEMNYLGALLPRLNDFELYVSVLGQVFHLRYLQGSDWSYAVTAVRDWERVLAGMGYQDLFVWDGITTSRDELLVFLRQLRQAATESKSLRDTPLLSTRDGLGRFEGFDFYAATEELITKLLPVRTRPGRLWERGFLRLKSLARAYITNVLATSVPLGFLLVNYHYSINSGGLYIIPALTVPLSTIVYRRLARRYPDSYPDLSSRAPWLWGLFLAACSFIAGGLYLLAFMVLRPLGVPIP